ncbi:P-loop NTPase fold protein [Vibrio kanaloae]|uniref:P-loop NTPase fold protein n=1 Tax=Vibrio TaxID=662 RepID=UPI000D350B71|nr:P-loop NTPase fold protein [Vibrio splendidus]PTP68757.1 hypothetical protein CWO23_15510 [Vibrio splendidus]
MTSKTTLQIIEQLKESSHPPIILLDGAWGIGKTHLIENELRPLIESAPREFGDYHYISAFGIQSVTEFQDQIVSLYISNQEEGSKYLNGLTGLSGKLARICGADSSEAGLIQGVISGTTGFLRQKAIQNMNNMTLIVDDLERLTDKKLIAEIMGTCLRFAEHNKIKIIAVANATAFKDKTKVEKSFSDVIKLTRTNEELLTIITDIYNGQLEPMIKENLFKALFLAQNQKIDIYNLRVLQRAINRIIKLVAIIIKIEGIDKRRCTERLTQHIVLITLYCYSNKCDLDTFTSILRSKEKWQSYRITEAKAKRNGDSSKVEELTKDDQQQQALFNQLTSLLNGLSCTEHLAEYCFTNLIPDLSELEFIERFQLPRLANPIDIFKTHTFYSFSSEEEFEEGVEQLELLLFTVTKANWSDWITCCDTYIFMHEQGYFEGTNIEELSKRLVNRLLNTDTIDLDTINQHRYRTRSYSSNSFNTPFFNKAIEEITERSRLKQREDITGSFLTDWRKTIYMPQSNIEHQPFFHNIDSNRLAEAIIQWKPMEIAEFTGFMINRYRVVNNPEKDQLELPVLRLLSSQLSQCRDNIQGQHRLQKGVLNELVNGLKIATNIIEERHGKENPH